MPLQADVLACPHFGRSGPVNRDKVGRVNIYMVLDLLHSRVMHATTPAAADDSLGLGRT